MVAMQGCPCASWTPGTSTLRVSICHSSAGVGGRPVVSMPSSSLALDCALSVPEPRVERSVGAIVVRLDRVIHHDDAVAGHRMRHPGHLGLVRLDLELVEVGTQGAAPEHDLG